MPTQGVLKRERAGRQVLATARTHARPVGERLETLLAPVLEEGETLPDIPHLLDLLTRLLESHLEDLVAAAEAHLAEQDDDREPRARRDEAADRVLQQLIGIRRLCNAAYGTESGDLLLGLQGSLPRDPLTLSLVGSRTRERLREPPDEGFPEPHVPGLDLDLAHAGQALEPMVDDLRRSLDDVAAEEREIEATRQRRNEATAAFDHMLRGVRQWLRASTELAKAVVQQPGA